MTTPPGGRPYPQVQRVPGLRWWRPLLALLVAPALAGVLFVVVGVWSAVAAELIDRDVETELVEGPPGFLFTNLLLAAAIPISMLAVLVGFGRRAGWLGSVEGHLRWGWLLRAAAAVVLWAVALTAVWFVLDGVPDTDGDDIAVLVLICLLTTPLQAAGEEYLIRGWLTQSLGAWFARPVLAAAVTALASATVFALLHGQQNPWLFVDRFAFGLLASYLAWRTGGLEAGIALHAGVNIASILPAVLEGTLDDSLAATDAPPLPVLVDVVALALAVFLLVRLGKRAGLRRSGGPGGAPAAAADNLGLPQGAR